MHIKRFSPQKAMPVETLEAQYVLAHLDISLKKMSVTLLMHIKITNVGNCYEININLIAGRQKESQGYQTCFSNVFYNDVISIPSGIVSFKSKP